MASSTVRRRSSIKSELSAQSRRSEQHVERMTSPHVDWEAGTNNAVPRHSLLERRGSVARPSRVASRSRLSEQQPPPEETETETEAAPPVPLLIRTARSILLPTILWPEIDSLIQLLAQMELYRVQVVEQAGELLKARSHFKGRAGDDSRSETTLRELMNVERQNTWRRNFKAIVFAAEKSAIMRRLRNGLITEAERAFSTYWPTERTLKYSAPTPLFLVISNTMSAAEVEQLDEEASGMSQEMRAIIAWCEDRTGDYTHAMFEKEFPDVADKKWINSALKWMDRVGQDVERIAELASDLLVQA